MARKRGGGGGDEGGNWMDTYGDLVTLLMTFFVLLYSMSSLDQSKWQLFVKSIYPGLESEDGETASNITIDSPVEEVTAESEVVLGESTFEETEVADVDINELYITLAKQMDNQGVDGVTVSRGADYTFVQFKNKAFFNGDSSVLTDQGKTALDVFCQVLAPEQEQVSQINIMGHTAQVSFDDSNTARGDRMLAAMRAAEVCIYIEEKQIMPAEKLVSMEYGQFRPVADNSTESGRSENRRVEILLIDKDSVARNPDEYLEEMASGVNEATTVTTDGNPETDLSFGAEAASTVVN